MKRDFAKLLQEQSDYIKTAHYRAFKVTTTIDLNKDDTIPYNFTLTERAINFRRSYLYIRINIKAADGKSDIKTKIQLSDGWISKLFKKARILIKDKEVQTISNIMMASPMKMRVNWSDENVGKSLVNGLDAKDKASGGGIHEGIISLGDLVPGFMDDVDTPIFNLNCSLILEKNTHANNDALFVYEEGKDNPKGSIIIEDMYCMLYVIDYQTPAKLALREAMTSNLYQYNFTFNDIQCLEFDVWGDEYTSILSEQYLGNGFIYFAVVGFVEKSSFNTQNKHINFTHASIKNCWITRNEQEYPPERENLNPDKKKYLWEFLRSMDYDRAKYGGSRNIETYHTPEMFLKYNWLMPIDMRFQDIDTSNMKPVIKINTEFHKYHPQHTSTEGLKMFVLLFSEKTMVYDFEHDTLEAKAYKK